MNAKNTRFAPQYHRSLTDRPETAADAPGSDITICVLASGSKGNAIYIACGECGLLIDAGLSATEITRRLDAVCISPDSISGIIVSHEHSDHIKGVGVLSRRYRLPVHINPKTENAWTNPGRLYQRHHFTSDSPFQIDPFVVRPFSISHDAADPVGFTVSVADLKIGIATDLGVATRLVRTHLKDCHALVLEANHDEQMLIRGPYPWPLKQRIQSRSGHLSNHTTRGLISELLNDRLQLVVLAHLSDTNNTPQKAVETVAPVLNNHRARLSVALQNRCTRLFRLKPPG